MIGCVLLFTFCVTDQIISSDNLIYAENFGALDAKMFMDSFKLPIGILAAGLSLILLLATQHRSAQTAEQIRLTIEANNNFLAQNTLRNYYDSITDFEKYINESYHSDILEIKNKRQLYKLFFPNNSHASVSPYTTKEIYIKNVERFLDGVNSQIKMCRESYEDEAVMFQNVINQFISSARVNYGVNINSNIFKVDKPVDAFLNMTSEVRQLLTFCMEYTPSNGAIIITNSSVYYLDEWQSIQSNGSTIDLLKYDVPSKDKKIKLKHPVKLFNKVN